MKEQKRFRESARGHIERLGRGFQARIFLAYIYAWRYVPAGIDDNLAAYAQMVDPRDRIDAEFLLWGQFMWDTLCSEVDVGRPSALLVDTDGDIIPDHYVTAIRYSPAMRQKKSKKWLNMRAKIFLQKNTGDTQKVLDICISQ